MKVYKWMNTLFLHTQIGTGKTPNGEEFRAGMAANGSAMYVSFKDGVWWVVKTEDIIRDIIAHRDKHMDDPADDNTKGEKS